MTPERSTHREIDDFWDLSDMLPEKKRMSPPVRSATACEATEIALGEREAARGEVIPPRGEAAPAAKSTAPTHPCMANQSDAIAHPTEATKNNIIDQTNAPVHSTEASRHTAPVHSTEASRHTAPTRHTEATKDSIFDDFITPTHPGEAIPVSPGEPQKRGTVPSYGEAYLPAGETIPPRHATPPPKPEAIRDYVPKIPLIDRVRVLPWPSLFGFYGKFRSDALRFLNRTHEACEYVYFFSYMPQYDQLSGAQFAYYLYWREEVRQGRYPKADNSYLFLYLYEIINLPDKIPPATGARLISALWAAYRGTFPYLDKYVSEWLCDYCLLYRVEPDRALLSSFLPEECGRLSFPEFYLDEGTLPFSLLAAISTYDYHTSKYYEEFHEAFDRDIPAAAREVAEKVLLPHLAEYRIVPMKLTKDTFSGAVACRGIKYKLEIECYPLKRSYPFRQLVTNLIKLCENQVRAMASVKSRFSPAGVDEKMRAAVGAYFGRVYPERTSAKRRTKSDAEPSYLALYEPKQTGPADISRALQIENEAWETAALLDGEAPAPAAPGIAPVLTAPGEAPAPTAPGEVPAPTAPGEVPAPAAPGTVHTPANAAATLPDVPSPGDDENPFCTLISTLGKTEHDALAAAMHHTFSAYCRACRLMPATVCAAINDAAADILGDTVLSQDGTPLPDYESDLLDAFKTLERT